MLISSIELLLSELGLGMTTCINQSRNSLKISKLQDKMQLMLKTSWEII